MPEDYGDSHVHEVPLPDGSTVMTGPPVGHEEMPAEAIAETAGGAAEPPAMGMRLGHRAPGAVLEAALRLKAENDEAGHRTTFDECVGAVMAQQGGSHRPAAAKSADPEADFFSERAKAAAALETGDTSLLPVSGRTIHERMRTSALRVLKGTRAREYAGALAWRAVRQKFKLGEYEDAQVPEAEAQAQVAEEAQEVEPLKRAKSATLSIARANGTGAFVVDVAPHRIGDLSAYGQVVTLPVPIAAGAAVRVGLAKTGRQIIDVRVPRAVIGASDPDLARVEAVQWTRKNWPSIWAVAKHLVRPTTPLTGQEKRSGSAWMRRSKFTLSADRAKEHIGYAEAYVPWEVDLQGQYATEDEVVRMAHGFMLRHGKIGEMHGRWRMRDGRSPGEIVESFIARDGDQHFVPGAWVVGIKCHPEVWRKVLTEEYKGVSIGGRWDVDPVELTALLN